jgi:hypothetical protein
MVIGVRVRNLSMATDTAPEIEEKLIQMYAEKSSYERLQMASSMFDAAKAIVIAGIKRDHPQYDEDRIRGELLIRLYGDCFTRTELKKIAARIPNMRLE